MRPDGLTFILQCEKLGSRQVLGGQAGWHPGLLTSGKDTFPVTMLLHLAWGYGPSEHGASGRCLEAAVVIRGAGM